MAGLSGNWLKEGAADAGAVGFGVAVVMRDYPGYRWMGLAGRFGVVWAAPGVWLQDASC
jgi:hypothetical protein